MSRLIDEAYDLKTIDLEAIRDLLPAAITAGARAAAQIPKKHDLKANPSYKSSSSDPFGIGSHRDLLLLPTGVAYECEDAGDSWDRLFSYGKQSNMTEAEYYRALEANNRVVEAQSKLKRVELMYAYDDSVVAPRNEFFQWLTPKGSRRLRILVADTLLGCAIPQAAWVYTSAEGEVRRTFDYDGAAVLHRFGNLSDKSLVIAVVKKPSASSRASNDVRCITSTDLEEMASDPMLAESKFGSSVVIQQFVRSSGCKPWMIRTTWSQSRPPRACVISNRKGFNKTADSKTAEAQLCTQSSSQHSCMVQLGPASQDCLETAEIAQRIASFAEGSIKPAVRFEEMTCDFVRDPERRWWLLQVKSFKLQKAVQTLT